MAVQEAGPGSPVWPARLDHLRLDSAAPRALVRFYEAALGLRARQIGEDLWDLDGPQRRLLIGAGPAESVAYAAFAIAQAGRLAALRSRLDGLGLKLEDSPSPLFAAGAFAVRDPDGQALVFGAPRPAPEPAAGGLPGRLQHVVFASARLDRQVAFYADTLGFLVSDRVVEDDGRLAACFLRCDDEHHAYAGFAAETTRFDHMAFETGGWTDIRDWADHFADMRLPLWWGPGRHGPGNNLFFMVRDPDGNRIELSAELERLPPELPPRTWPHEPHTLNLWGQAWMRG